MLIENQRHIFGPPHRRGPHDLSRLPRAFGPSVLRTPPASIHPDHRPPCSRWPFPTDSRVCALDESVASLFWPSPPIGGVSASNVTSIAAVPFMLGPEAVRCHRVMGSSIS